MNLVARVGRISRGSRRGVEAVRLLQEADERVAGHEVTGTRVPQREQNHDRLVAAHDLGT